MESGKFTTPPPIEPNVSNLKLFNFSDIGVGSQTLKKDSLKILKQNVKNAGDGFTATNFWFTGISMQNIGFNLHPKTGHLLCTGFPKTLSPITKNTDVVPNSYTWIDESGGALWTPSNCKFTYCKPPHLFSELTKDDDGETVYTYGWDLENKDDYGVTDWPEISISLLCDCSGGIKVKDPSPYHIYSTLTFQWPDGASEPTLKHSFDRQSVLYIGDVDETGVLSDLTLGDLKFFNINQQYPDGTSIDTGV